MNNSVDKATNSISVYVDFENEGKILVPNAYVTVLVEEIFKNSLVVEKNNISLQENGNFIYLIRNGILIKEPAHILASEGSFFIIKNDFQKNDLVVLDTVKESDLNKKVNALVNKTAHPTNNLQKENS